MKQFIKKFIPPKYTQKLANFKMHFTGFGKKTYSTSGEDVVLANLFSTRENGFYVDVGAFHPFYLSNTYILYKKGWSGLNIDPNPDSIKAFNKYRPRDKNVCLAVGDKGEMTYYRFSHAGANTLSKEIAERKKEEPWMTLLGEEKIKITPLSEILEKYLPAKTTIDVLDIDVEGLDYEVLESNNWEKFKPRVILIEVRNFDVSIANENEVYRFLTYRGYKLCSFVGITLVFKLKI